jgi:hypothetical protein
MYIAGVFLFLSSIFAVRQRLVDWKDRPEKRRKLRFGIGLLAFGIVLMIPLGFWILG